MTPASTGSPLSRLDRSGWRVPVDARLAAAIAAVASVATLAGCQTRCPRSDGAALQLRTVPVPAEATVDVELPPEFDLRQGEVVQRQNFSLDASGRFTFSRTMESETGYLGAVVAPLDGPAAEGVGREPFTGVLVSVVESPGPAHRAGLRARDIIVRYGDEEVRSPDRLRFLVERTTPGTSVPIEYLQAGTRISTDLEVGSETRIVRSKTIQRELEVYDDSDRTGLTLIDVPRELRSVVFGEDASGGGLLIASILEGGPSFYSPLRVGDRLEVAAGRPTDSILEYREALAAASGSGARSGAFAARRRKDVVEAELSISEGARDVSGFDLAGVASYESRPRESELRLLWGLLFNYHACRYIDTHPEVPRHVSRSEWGMVLDLLAWESRPGRKTLSLLWIFPLRFGAGED